MIEINVAHEETRGREEHINALTEGAEKYGRCE